MPFPARKPPASGLKREGTDPAATHLAPGPSAGLQAPVEGVEQHVRLQIALKVIETTSKLGLDPHSPIMLEKADAIAKWVLTGDRPT